MNKPLITFYYKFICSGKATKHLIRLCQSLKCLHHKQLPTLLHISIYHTGIPFDISLQCIPVLQLRNIKFLLFPFPYGKTNVFRMVYLFILFVKDVVAIHIVIKKSMSMFQIAFLPNTSRLLLIFKVNALS